MIPFDQISSLITKEEANNLRILDASGNKILDIQEASPANAITALNNYGQMLSGYGKITIKGGDDASLKGHFTQAAVWKVYFPNIATTSPGPWQQAQASGLNASISKEYMNLAIELEKLKNENVFDKKFRDLEERLGKKNNLPIPMEYLPFIGEFFGWDDKKMFQKLQMSAMAGNLGSLGKMVQDNASGNKLSVTGTDAEKEKVVETLVPEIWKDKSSDWRTKFASLLTTVKATPGFIDQIYEMAKMHGQLAGPPAGAQRLQTTVTILDTRKLDDEKF